MKNELLRSQLDVMHEAVKQNKKELKQDYKKLKRSYRKAKKSNEICFNSKDGALYSKEENETAVYTLYHPKLREAAEENLSLFCNIDSSTFSRK